MIDGECPHHGSVRCETNRCDRPRARWKRNGDPIVVCGKRLRGAREVEEVSDEEAERYVEEYAEAFGERWRAGV